MHTIKQLCVSLKFPFYFFHFNYYKKVWKYCSGFSFSFPAIKRNFVGTKTHKNLSGYTTQCFRVTCWETPASMKQPPCPFSGADLGTAGVLPFSRCRCLISAGLQFSQALKTVHGLEGMAQERDRYLSITIVKRKDVMKSNYWEITGLGNEAF